MCFDSSSRTPEPSLRSRSPAEIASKWQILDYGVAPLCRVDNPRGMPSTNGFPRELAHMEARVDWLIRRLEALDARLVVLELRTARAGTRPQSRAVRPATKANEALRTRSAAATPRQTRRR